jgi:hypothetical protein
VKASLHLIIAVACVATVAVEQAQDLRRRVALRKSEARVESPAKYQMRIRTASGTGNPVEYDPKPRVVLVNGRTGRYQLKWIGYDGNEKTIDYQRPDAIDVIVSADVTSSVARRFKYTYLIQNLATSGESLSGFAVQTFAKDVTPVQMPNVFTGQLKGAVVTAGSWLRFAPLTALTPQVTPGRSIAFTLESAALPGLVECRAHGGPLGLKGVGEEMPAELENVLLSQAAWPRGHTIGPDDRLTAMSPTLRRQQLVTWLAEFQRLGWMTADAQTRYEKAVPSVDASELQRMTAADLRAGAITPEVVAVVRELLTQAR